MKKMKHILSLIILFVVASCDYLDIVPDSIATIEDNAFSMRAQAEKYLFTCYSYLPLDGSSAANPALLTGDEIWVTKDYTSANNAVQIALGNQRSNEPYLDYWRGAYNGKNLYRGISDCNIFLENIHRVPDMTLSEKQRWIAEVEFLKAYYHFYLIRMYGAIPIKDKNLSITSGMDNIKVYRNTIDECFDYVANKLDSVIGLEHLPEIIQNEAEETGRITQGIAMALKAKVLVTAASPLFNGNIDYVGLTDNRGIEIFNPVKTNEQKQLKWAEAAKACKEAIDFLAFHGKDKLYRYESGEYVISDATRTKLGIRMSFTDKWNNEIIWANSISWVGGGNDYQAQAIPRDLDAGKSTANTAQRNNHAVPLKIAMQFYTKNGVPITEDKTWNYNERFAVKMIEPDQQYLLAVGEQTAGLNINRELRYYASLGFDRGIWFGQGLGDGSETSQYLKARYGEIAANSINHSWNLTGIWPKKVLHFKTTVSASGTGVTYIRYPFPIIRLSELYLMYAESLNEMGEEHRIEALQYIDMVRERAGLQGVAPSWDNYSSNPGKYKTQQGLREIIQQETLIEFVFEGHRFWDLRRWKTAIAEYAKPITGWNLIYKDPQEYYTERYLYTQKFTPRDYFWPIHDGEILRNGNTVQNYGW